MSRRDWYVSSPKKTIGRRFAELSSNSSSGSRSFFSTERYRERFEDNEDVVSYLHKLSIRELQILTGRDVAKMHPYHIRTTYRSDMIAEAKRCFHRLDSDKLQRLAKLVPFTVHIRKANTSRVEHRRRGKKRRPKLLASISSQSLSTTFVSDEHVISITGEEDERDWDCRPTTVGEVTEEDLDRELDEYFRKDPERHKAVLDDEIDEYMARLTL
jgi:hypothetical protein